MSDRTKSLLASLNCDGRRGLALLATLGLLALLGAGGQGWRMALRYERPGLLHGEWWRLLGGQLVHLNLRHLLLDATGLVLLWVLFARALPPLCWLLVLLASLVAIDAGLWWGAPQVQWYVGSSGLLHGVWAAGALALLRAAPIPARPEPGAAARATAGGSVPPAGEARLGGVLLAALVAKLAYEHHSAASLLVSDFPVVVVAHLYGALGGVAGLGLWALARKPL